MPVLNLQDQKTPGELLNARQVTYCLIDAYPDASLPDFGDDPLDAALWGIMAQREYPHKSKKAFNLLKSRHSGWSEFAGMNVEGLASCLKSAGLNFYRNKAQQIIACLNEVHRRNNEYSLKGSSDLENDIAGLPGIGPRTTAIISLFFMNRPDLPPESAVTRIAKRLGWIDGLEKKLIVKRLALLAGILEIEEMQRLYLCMTEHGCRVCLADRPRCSLCVILEFCIREKT